MKITVTQEHIDNGDRGSCTHDPIALAMRNAGLEAPWVGPAGISWKIEHRNYFMQTPRIVLDFMLAFDNKQPVEPFEFSLGE